MMVWVATVRLLRSHHFRPGEEKGQDHHGSVLIVQRLVRTRVADEMRAYADASLMVNAQADAQSVWGNSDRARNVDGPKAGDQRRPPSQFGLATGCRCMHGE